jgi:hypothetical protein
MKSVWANLHDPQKVHSIKYRKLDGSSGSKIGVRKSGLGGVGKGKTDIASINKIVDHDDSMFLESFGRTFEIKPELLIEFNGMRVFHSY